MCANASLKGLISLSCNDDVALWLFDMPAGVDGLSKPAVNRLGETKLFQALPGVSGKESAHNMSACSSSKTV